jgi:TonB family protein
MRYIALFLCVGSFLGCASTRQSDDPAAPQLLFQCPLPEIPESIKKPPPQIEMRLFIKEDGSVEKVRLLDQSGNTAWDSLAIERIRQWRFLPARRDSHPVSSWFYLQAAVKYVRPLHFSLAAIFCTTQEEATSLYTALEGGKNFDDLGTRYSTDTSRGHFRDLGIINIYSYPEKVRQALLDLDVGEYTEPIKYGDDYAIFKRFKE